MAVLIFLIGALLGMLLGTALCVRYLRQELTARLGPSLDLLGLKLDNVHSAVNIALANWHAELHKNHHPAAEAANQPPRRHDAVLTPRSRR